MAAGGGGWQRVVDARGGGRLRASEEGGGGRSGGRGKGAPLPQTGWPCMRKASEVRVSSS